MATAAETQALIADLGCRWCIIPAGMVPYVILQAAINYGNGMTTPTEAQEAMAEAAGLGKIPGGQVNRAILAVLIDIAEGRTPPTDPDEILAETACLCTIPEGMVPYAILATLANLP